MLDTPQLMDRQIACYDASIAELERRMKDQEFATLAAERRAPRTVDNLREQRERLEELRRAAS
ncbi:hypothetical protein [Thioalkalivibrio sp. ALgr3]|uniref:hypothetical protein n=1 Tax=Thioalkalivibrio sp. ALgr3 TaxID=1239292 RepID=UPI0003609BBD|nr:hypothetical protein [Thioalkalivibrio sp. ALgr3]